MKKLVSVFLTLVCLLSLAGCGGTMDHMGREGSLYPYGWSENDDGTIDFRIRGKWDKTCHWVAECDPEALTCTPVGRKGDRFTVGSLAARTTEVDFRLYRDGAELWEYDLWLRVQGNGTGGVIVLEDNYAEPVQEGSYTIAAGENGMAEVRIHTDHVWKSRVVNLKLRSEVQTLGNGECVFGIDATGESAGTVELYDTEADRLLALQVSADANGTVTVETVEERQDTAFSQESIDTLWEQLGVAFPVSPKMTVSECRISQEEDVSPFPCGEMEVTINGKTYEYLVTLGSEWTEEYIPAPDEDPDAGGKESRQEAAIRESLLEPGGVPVTVYTQGSHSCAVWKQYGANFMLAGEADSKTLSQAMETLLGGQS